MFIKIKNIFFFASFGIFFILIAFYYFSDENIIKTNKIRSTYNLDLTENTYNLPLLKNDTNNIIEFSDDLEIFKKKKKKYKFWDLINK